MKRKIEALQKLASELVGDGKSPDLFFVTDEGVTVTVTRSFDTAYQEWQSLSSRYPRIESALENRTFGVIASVEPDEDGSKRLIIIDDSDTFKKRAA